jgi:thioredoxin-like negative regulator of GroEL
MRLTVATCLAAACFALAPGVVRAQSPEIRFRNNYGEARQEAEKRGLPIVLYLTTDNCMWCQRLVAETFGDPNVAKVMNEKFIPLKIHAAQEPGLIQTLKVSSFPTVILAGPDGKILMTVQGFKDAVRFHDDLQRVLVALTNPEWMLRDYQIADKAIQVGDYARAVALLKAIVEDGKNRPVQVNSEILLKQVEQQAAGELASAKQMLDKGKSNEASMLLAKLVKDYAGTQAAPAAATMLTSMAKTPDMRGQQRTARARELLAQARDDYRTEQWLCCLDRCDLLVASYGDLAEASDALTMAGAIRSNPEWMQKTCESMAVRLGEMYLGLAETWMQKGQPQQAMLCLERVMRTFPGSRQAEAAQFRLSQLQGLPTQRPESQK